MVTFVCETCDTTLKKKQLKNHTYSCRTNAFLCIDCKKRFVGNEHEGHTSCMSEQEMTWGPYFKGNKNNKTQGNNQHQKNGTNGNQLNGNHNHLAEETKVDTPQIPQQTITEEKEVDNEPITFKGWQKTIKALLKQETDHTMKKSTLKKKLKQILIEENYDLNEDEYNESVDKVLAMRAFEVTDGHVKYLPSGQREAKKQKNSSQFKDFNWTKKNYRSNKQRSQQKVES